MVVCAERSEGDDVAGSEASDPVLGEHPCSVLQDTGENGTTHIPPQLAAIDWDFLDRQAAHSIESVHPYPAKFIGEIPRALLETLPVPPGTAVLDPFCGSGTTLVESQRVGLRSIGIDLNPIACLMSRVKTSECPAGFLEQAEDVVAAAERNESPEVPAIPNLDHWFKQPVQVALAALVGAIDSLSRPEGRDALRLALSSIIVRVSNQDSDTRYAAVHNNVEGVDVFIAYLAACRRLYRALDARTWPLAECQVIEADVLELSGDAVLWPIGLVVTSPPYPNAYEYWLYHKYRMWWLGYDPIAVKHREIGARAHFFTRNPHTENDFVEQMRSTFAHIDSVLVRNGYACVIVGRSRIHGRDVDNAEIVDSAAQDVRFSRVGRFERNIASQRKSFNLSHANIKQEEVLVFKKVGD